MIYSAAGGRGPRVVTASRLPLQQGVKPGMPLAEAEALIERPLDNGPNGLKSDVPEASFQPADLSADVAGLRKLSSACERFTPLFGVEESELPECLLLDLTGCSHLFGGQQETAASISHEFDQRQFQARVAVTPTIGAAWAAAHFLAKPAAPSVVEPPRLVDVLKSLPVESLRLTPNILSTLHELGLRSVGQLLGLQRDSLPSRFGPMLLKRLDQALGDEPELLTPEKPHEPLVVSWVGEFPITDRESLSSVCRELLDQLVSKLKPRREGLRQLRCDFRDTSGRLYEFRVGVVAPTDQARHVFDMLCLQWERATLPDEVAFVLLEVTAVDALHVVQRDLFGNTLDAGRHREVVTLLDRLSNRLGPHAVVRARLLPDAQPELSVAHEPCANAVAAVATSDRTVARVTSQRPSRLLSSPQPIEVSIAGPEGAPLSFWWDRREQRVVRAWGPERIETGWWRECSACRDYFRVEVQTGHHFWIFRRLDDPGWFLHGAFD